MSNQKPFGKCALCGKECELTFEHIPPREAFNKAPAKPVSGKTVKEYRMETPWDLHGLKYDNQQKGMGIYSLCKKCNNDTGSWYGNSYAEFAYGAFHFLSNTLPNNARAIEFKQISPLNIIKQVVSMFCSINNCYDIDINELRMFVLNKDSNSFDKSKYRIQMYFTKSPLMKYAPFSVTMIKSENDIVIAEVSEITAAPFGFILYFNPTDQIPYKGINITDFADFTFDEKVDMGFPICIYEMNDILPTMYRSKEEIAKTVNENKKRI